MPRNTDFSTGRRDSTAPGRGAIHGARPLQALWGRLGDLGFTVPELFGVRQDVAGGVPLQVPVRRLLAGTNGIADTIRTLLRDRVAVTFALTDLGSGDAAIDRVRTFCKRVLGEVQAANGCSNHVGICMHAHQAPLVPFLAATASVPGPRYVLLDRAFFAHHCNRRHARELDWQLLWRHRLGAAALSPAYAGTVRPGCRLLDDEAATSVLPVYGIQVPASSAWLPLGLYLPRFANGCGKLQWDRLSGAITAALDLTEEVMSRLHWPHPGQRADAIANRRLALSVNGLGDLVARRGLDPRQLDTLEWLTAIVRRIRDTLWLESGRLARSVGCLPALRDGDPSIRWNAGDHREHWKRRWQAALDEAAVRHRNMLVMSPYTVLPSDGNAAFGYTDLLPVIAFADAWSFTGVSCCGNLREHEFTIFHRRAWAVIRGREADSFVAAGV